MSDEATQEFLQVEIYGKGTARARIAYPCFVPLDPGNEKVLLVDVDGTLCFTLFNSKEEMHEYEPSRLCSRVLIITDRGHLVQTLCSARRASDESPSESPSHFIISPINGQKPLTVDFPTAIAAIESA